jgi:hypothetical protein
MKDARIAIGFLFVVGIWYGVGYIQGYSTGELVGYDNGYKAGEKVGKDDGVVKAATPSNQ